MTASAYQPLDLDAIRRDNPLADVVAGAGVKLLRSGREWKACCPFHSEKTPSFTIFAGGERYHCFGCGANGDVLDFVQGLHGVDLPGAARMLGADTLPRVALPPSPPAPDKSEAIAEARAIWRSAIPATGTLVETYLRSRAIACQIPPTVRFKPLPRFEGSNELPCLVAALSSPDGVVTGIQRTWLKSDGSGRLERVPKLSLGVVSGSAIRLAPVAQNMVVCSGLEDGLSLQQELSRAVWAVPGDTNLPKLQLPPEVRSVAIAGDNDESGQLNTLKAAQAFADQGLEARRFFPLAHHDFNSELMEAASEQA